MAIANWTSDFSLSGNTTDSVTDFASSLPYDTNGNGTSGGGGGGDQWSNVFSLVNSSVVDLVDVALNDSSIYDTGTSVGVGVSGTGARLLVNSTWIRLFNGTREPQATARGDSEVLGSGPFTGQDLGAAAQFPNDDRPTWPGDSLYPSGHSLTHIVVTAVLVTIIMITVVVGNMLVIVAIVTEKALKTIQNWFIASLAVADFFLGLVVMPFSLAQELMGYWIFGSWWCEIHLAVDVLLCTSSIMNLCLISLDRYWSITQAVDYLKKRTPTRAAIMITSVWILSFLVSVPPLLGWKNLKQAKEEDLPYCEVSDDTGYVIYSASGSFYIPSVIMVFVYVRIYFAARSRARRVVRKPRPTLDATKDKSTTTTSFSNTSPPDKTKTGMACTTSVEVTMALAAPDGPVPLRLPLPSLSLSLSPATSPAAPSPSSSSSSFFFSRRFTKSRQKEKDKTNKAVNGNTSSSTQVPIPGPQQQTCSSSAPASPSAAACSGHSNAAQPEDTECGSEMDHSSDSERTVGDSGVGNGSGRRRGGVDSGCGGGGSGGFRRLHHLCNPPARKSSKARRDEIDLGRIQKPRDPEREKRRIARKKERRATLILGLIMTAFILSWLPFFTLYVVRGLCKSCRDWISGLGFGFTFWLGYCNSALNPVIYTIFSKDFRRAFRKILFK